MNDVTVTVSGKDIEAEVRDRLRSYLEQKVFSRNESFCFSHDKVTTLSFTRSPTPQDYVLAGAVQDEVSRCMGRLTQVPALVDRVRKFAASVIEGAIDRAMNPQTEPVAEILGFPVRWVGEGQVEDKTVAACSVGFLPAGDKIIRVSSVNVEAPYTDPDEEEVARVEEKFRSRWAEQSKKLGG